MVAAFFVACEQNKGHSTHHDPEHIASHVGGVLGLQVQTEGIQPAKRAEHAEGKPRVLQPFEDTGDLAPGFF